MRLILSAWKCVHNDDPILTTMRFIPQHEVVQRYGVVLPEYLTSQAIKESEAYKTYHDLATGKVAKSRKKKQPALGLETLSEVALTEAKQLKLATKRSLIQTHSSHVSGSGVHKGTGATPGVPDVPKYGSDDEQLSWKSSDVEDDDDEANILFTPRREEELNVEDSFDPRVQTPSHDSTTDDDHDDDDDEWTESDNDGEDFVHPNFLTYDDEARQEEEENKEDSFDPKVQTPSHVSTTDDDNDDEIQGANVAGEEMDKEATNVLRESSFQNIQPRKFLRSGSHSNVGYEKSCQSSKFGSDLGQITRFVLVFVEAAKQSGEATCSLISLSRGSFDVIVGIDWLSKRKFVIVCHEKVVELPLEGSRKLRVQGECTLGVAKALMKAKVDEPKVGDISVVRDFVDVFLEDLSGLPPQRQDEST
ncbi:hypothetical protein Tco_1371559 [Tanacetum coccineum]